MFTIFRIIKTKNVEKIVTFTIRCKHSVTDNSCFKYNNVYRIAIIKNYETINLELEILAIIIPNLT